VIENFKEVAEFIKEHLIGCKFVGISSDNEVFVEFEYDDPEMQNGAALRLRREFSYLSKVTIVVRPSIEEVKQMVDDLNKFLDEKPSEKNNLLDIGEF